MVHPDSARLRSGLPHVLGSPADRGRVELLVRRPRADARERLTHAELDTAEGLVGDTWAVRGSSRSRDGAAHPDMQVALINARLATLVAGDPDRRDLAGDQIFVNLDLSEPNLPAGTCLRLGTALVEVTTEPHLGCKKFAKRFGVESLRFVNSQEGRLHRLRGMYVRVLESGIVCVGDLVRRSPSRETLRASTPEE